MTRALLLLLILVSVTGCVTPLFVTKQNIKLYKIIKNNHIGYIDQKGKIRIKPQFDLYNEEGDWYEYHTDEFDPSELAIVNKEGLYGLIDWNGKWVLKPQFKVLISEGANYFIAKNNDKYGVIDSEGTVKIPFLFDSEYFLNPFSIFPGKINNKWVLFDPIDNKIIETDYDYISPFLNGFARIEKNKKLGLIDKSAKIILEPKYEDIGYLSNGLLNVKENGFWKYISLNKKQVFETEFDYADPFEYGFAIVKKGKYGMIDTLGRTIIPFRYEFLRISGSNSLKRAPIMFCNQEDYFIEGAKCGLINSQCDTILNPLYCDIFYFDGIAELSFNEEGRMGVINVNTGEVLIPFEFESVDYDEDGLSILHFRDLKGKKYFGYVNQKKKIVWSNNKELLERKLKVNG